MRVRVTAHACHQLVQKCGICPLQRFASLAESEYQAADTPEGQHQRLCIIQNAMQPTLQALNASHHASLHASKQTTAEIMASCC